MAGYKILFSGFHSGLCIPLFLWSYFRPYRPLTGDGAHLVGIFQMELWKPKMELWKMFFPFLMGDSQVFPRRWLGGSSQPPILQGFFSIKPTKIGHLGSPKFLFKATSEL